MQHQFHDVRVFGLASDPQHAVAEPQAAYQARGASSLPKTEMQKLIQELETKMKEAAQNLEFEQAAALRDQIYELREILAEDESLKPWERIRILAGE